MVAMVLMASYILIHLPDTRRWKPICWSPCLPKPHLPESPCLPESFWHPGALQYSEASDETTIVSNSLWSLLKLLKQVIGNPNNDSIWPINSIIRGFNGCLHFDLFIRLLINSWINQVAGLSVSINLLIH